MLDTVTPQVSRRIEVNQLPIQLTVGGGTFDPLCVEFPPVEEISRMRGLGTNHVSFHQVQRDSAARFQQAFLLSATALESKRAKYSDSPDFHARLADLFYLAGNREKSFELNSTARQLSKETIYGLRCGSDLLAVGRFAEADELFSNLEELDLSERLARRAAIALLQNRFDVAHDRATEAVSVGQDNDKARYLLGITCLVRSECAQAIRHFRAAGENYPRSVPLLVNLAIGHVCMGQDQKALDVLRRAVNINPIHRTAVCMLADLAFTTGQAELSIRPLELYLHYDQQSADVWARVARAYVAGGKFEKALSSLKNQVSLEETPSVLNNIGVVSHELGRDALVGQYFSRAATFCSRAEAIEEWGVPTRNFMAWLLEHNRDDEVLKVGKEAIERNRDEILSNEEYSEILFFFLTALLRSRRDKEFVQLTASILENAKTVDNLKIAVHSDIIYYYTLVLGDFDLGSRAAERAVSALAGSQFRGPAAIMLLNNVAFTLLEVGRLHEAKAILGKLQRLFHEHPYVTATLGLYHFKRGDFERGERLYREAVQLIPQNTLKLKFMQKLHLELGLHHLGKNEFRAASKFLLQARDAKGGVEVLAQQARSLLQRLPS